MEPTIPIILCGKTAEIASAVTKGLQPEVEGIASLTLIMINLTHTTICSKH
jgi:hypothetical protein